MQRIINFIKLLLSDSGQISSKRFAGITALLNAVVLGYIDTYGHKITEFVFDGFIMFSAAAFGLTVVSSFTKKKDDTKTEEEVKSEEVKSETTDPK